MRYSAAATRLKLIAHTAGSIKRMLPPAVFARRHFGHPCRVRHCPGRGRTDASVNSAQSAPGPQTGPHHENRRALGGEPSDRHGAGTGRQSGRRGRRGLHGPLCDQAVTALNAEVWVYDPYLAATWAAELGVRSVPLHELFANCPIVTMQAPPTKETYHIIGAKELSLLQDGAVFVNTARSHLVDQDALLAALRTGRFQAALDVFDQEPLPAGSPFRQLDNVILTPHVAGASKQARLTPGANHC